MPPFPPIPNNYPSRVLQDSPETLVGSTNAGFADVFDEISWNKRWTVSELRHLAND
jgi:hypothetical protein